MAKGSHMKLAARRTSTGFTPQSFSTTVRKIVQGAVSIALVFALTGNAAFAQAFYDDEPVTIVPRVRPTKTHSVSDDANGQQPATQTTSPADSQNQPPANTKFVLPPGTKLPLGLVRPLSIKTSSAKGAGVYLQVTFPV